MVSRYKYIKVRHRTQRLKPNYTETTVAVRTAIEVAERESSSVRTTVVSAPTYEERIARIREVGVVAVPACANAV